jgi:hypothetical protein
MLLGKSIFLWSRFFGRELTPAKTSIPRNAFFWPQTTVSRPSSPLRSLSRSPALPRSPASLLPAHTHVMQVPRVPLGATGMQVSVLGMGCSPLGHSYGVSEPCCTVAVPSTAAITDCICVWLALQQEADAQTAIQAVHEAYAAGINFFDVSPFYGSGRAEQVRPHSHGTPGSTIPVG